MIHTVKGSIVVNEAEVDVFLEFSCFFYDPVDAGNLISGSSAFSKSSLYIWKFMVHILLKPSLKGFVFDPKLAVEVYMWTFVNLSEVGNIESPSLKKWPGQLLWLKKKYHFNAPLYFVRGTAESREKTELLSIRLAV